MEQETVSLATYLPVLKFDDGDVSYLKVFQDLTMKPGMFTSQGNGKCDQSRIRLSAKKAKETEKVRRKTLRYLRKSTLMMWKRKGGAVYEAGGF